MDGRDFMGGRLVVQYARERRNERDRGYDRDRGSDRRDRSRDRYARRSRSPPRRRFDRAYSTKHRVTVEGLASDVSWQVHQKT